MLDGKNYYAAFPDENPDVSSQMQAVFRTLLKLEEEFRHIIDKSKAETAERRNSNNP